MGFVVIENLEQFNKVVTENTASLVIGYFTANWCGPCKNISPVLVNIGENNEHIIVLKIDVDECEEIAAEYNIDCMPTFKFFVNNNLKEYKSISGADRNLLISTIQEIFDGSNESPQIEQNNANNDNDNDNNENNENNTPNTPTNAFDNPTMPNITGYNSIFDTNYSNF